MAIDRLRDNKIIILDTNALFIPFKFKLNLDLELKRLLGVYQIIIPSCVLNELKRLTTREKFGEMAYELAQRKSAPGWYIELEPSIIAKISKEDMEYEDNPIDNEILQIAKELNGIVLTNDKEFLKRLATNRIRTISLKSRKYLKLSTTL